MNIIKYSNFKLVEGLDSELKDKLSGKYSSLKRGVILLIENNIKSDDKLTELQQVLVDIRDKGINNVKLIGFIENTDIYNFYLKYQNDIDELLKDEKYYNIKPSDNSVYSLYDFVIDGTKKSVDFISEQIEAELF